ncbi:MAG: Rrf2 family transcriptional regulator [Phycisphaerales bacterium]|jgi:Rrf2 family transcriptional regulator, cysteine metabolism repressor|nr:Rrf2 family transcriptional regulator [Phycisphaerales bacterium]
MSVSQKCQYALRALFELARRDTNRPTAMTDIAKIQAIPPKFLELILSELRQGGFIDSRRGRGGGYVLKVRPEALTIGVIIRFVDGPVAPVKCVAGDVPSEVTCRLYGNCAFMDMWSRARDAVASVYDNTTFQDLVDKERLGAEAQANTYCI